MNARVALDAFLGFIISFGGSLGVLFTTPGVAKFSDISEVSYAAAFVLALIATAKLVQSRLADSPANVSQANDIVAAAANLDIKQSGFVRPALLWLLLAAVLLAITTGCAQNTPRKSIATASIFIEQLAIQIDAAERSGQITNAREDQLMDELKAVNSDLRTANYLVGDQRIQSLESINDRLLRIRAELALAEERTR